MKNRNEKLHGKTKQEEYEKKKEQQIKIIGKSYKRIKDYDIMNLLLQKKTERTRIHSKRNLDRMSHNGIIQNNQRETKK